MSSVASELGIIVLLVLLNGALSMAEIAIVSSRRARLEELAQRNVRGARLALQLVDDPTQFLATVQIGITLVGVVAGAYAGVTVGEELGEHLKRIPALAAHSEGLGVGLVVAVTTYLSLVIGELLPKRIALTYREPLAVRLAPPMWLLQRLASPLVWVLTASTAAIIRLLRLRRTSDPSITESELVQIVREGEREGVFETAERDMIEGVLELDSRPLGSAMPPRHKMVWLDTADDPADLLRVVATTGYSRYPVCAGSPDAVIGVVTAKKLLAHGWRGEVADLAAMARPAVFLPESASALDALQKLRDAEVRLALVVDEYGSIQGLCSLNDVLRTLLGGDIAGPAAARPSAIDRLDGTHLVDGMMPARELPEHLVGLELPEGDLPFHTVAGLVMAELGAIPQVGDSFTWQGYRFEVLDMDGYRVDKVLVVLDPGADDGQPSA